MRWGRWSNVSVGVEGCVRVAEWISEGGMVKEWGE